MGKTSDTYTDINNKVYELVTRLHLTIKQMYEEDAWWKLEFNDWIQAATNTSKTFTVVAVRLRANNTYTLIRWQVPHVKASGLPHAE